MVADIKIAELLVQVRECLSVAEGLYFKRKDFYKPVFGWINGQFKKGKKPPEVLAALQILANKEKAGNPANEVLGYLHGIMRSLEKKKETVDLRKGRATSLREILAECLRVSQEIKRKEKAGA